LPCVPAALVDALGLKAPGRNSANPHFSPIRGGAAADGTAGGSVNDQWPVNNLYVPDFLKSAALSLGQNC